MTGTKTITPTQPTAREQPLPRITASWKSNGKTALIHNAPLGKQYDLRAEISGPLAPRFVPMFAAAPDLLASLQNMIQFAEACHRQCDDALMRKAIGNDIVAARAAITLAQGEAQ